MNEGGEKKRRCMLTVHIARCIYVFFLSSGSCTITDYNSPGFETKDGQTGAGVANIENNPKYNT